MYGRDLSAVLRSATVQALALAFIGDDWDEYERNLALDTVFAAALAGDMHEWGSDGWRAQILGILAIIDLAKERGLSPTWAATAYISSGEGLRGWFAAQNDDLEARVGRITFSGLFDRALEAAMRTQREVKDWVEVSAEVRSHQI